MTLSESHIRAMRRTMARYADHQLDATIKSRLATMADCLDKCDDALNQDDPLVQEYEKSLVIHNCAMDEQDRRRTGAAIESLPGMDPLSASSHTMNGR